MKLSRIVVIAISLVLSKAWAADSELNYYQVLKSLQGNWKLAPAKLQEGGATKKGPAAKLLGTGKTAMSFKVIGKGSTVQENLMPGTGMEMATMYHCDNFNNCTQVKATHYCVKQNQPQFILAPDDSSSNVVTMACDMSSSLCNSMDGHIHKITQELSPDGNHLTTTYTIFKDGKFQNNVIYHFVRQ